MSTLSIFSLIFFVLLTSYHVATGEPFYRFNYDPYRYYRPSNPSYASSWANYRPQSANYQRTQSYYPSASSYQATHAYPGQVYSSPAMSTTTSYQASYPSTYKYYLGSYAYPSSSSGGYTSNQNSYKSRPYTFASSSNSYSSRPTNYESAPLTYATGYSSNSKNSLYSTTHGTGEPSLYSSSSRTQRNRDPFSTLDMTAEEGKNVQENAIEDEPKFLGRGEVEINNQKVIVTCSLVALNYELSSPIDWVRITGPYEYSTTGDLPYVCATTGCIYEFVSSNSSRHKVLSDQQLSFLILNEPEVADQGYYRCSSVQTSTEDGRNQTFYQVIKVAY